MPAPRIDPFGMTSDQELIRRLLDGDEAAFTDLVGRTHRSMVRVALQYVSTRDVAEEVVQETWVAILRGLSRFEGRSALNTWMFRILVNRARTRGVREGRTVPASALGAADEAEPVVDPSRFADDGHWSTRPQSWTATPEKLALDQEVRARIDAAIEQLPERQRAVITLRDLEGWSSDEVCNVLEISDTNQRVLLHRARSKVRETLETFLITPDPS